MGSASFLGGGFGHFYVYAPEKIEYAIANIANWPWYGQLALGRLYDAGEFLQVQEYAHVQRWAQEIDARPAVQSGRMVNRTFGESSMQRHDASDFATKTQDTQGVMA